METVDAFGYLWRWNGSLTVNVFDGDGEIFCYTLSEPSILEYLASIPEMFPSVIEIAEYF